MIPQVESEKSPKYTVEVKQKETGEWYLASFKINSDSDEELFDSLNLAIEGVNRTLNRLNSNRIPAAPNANEKMAQKPAVQKPKEKAPKKPAEEIFLTPDEIKLYTALRDLRNELALRDNCPTYMVVPNSTVRLMAKNKPETREEMLKISGMGDKRFERYGNDFIEMIKKFKALGSLV